MSRSKIEITLKDSKKVLFKKFYKRKRGITLTEGQIKNVPIGAYSLCINSSCQDVSVGDVFLVAGQSNAVSSAQNHFPYSSSTNQVVVSAISSNLKTDYSFLIKPTEADPQDSNISWIYLGDLIYEKYKIPVAFYNIAVGNTSTEKWKPDNNGLIRRFDDVLRSKKAKAILWVQGESDCGENISLVKTYQNLRDIILYSKKIDPSVIWVVAIDSLGREKCRDTRTAQKLIINNGLALLGPDNDIIRDDSSLVDPSGAEFIGRGLKVHAQLWFERLEKLRLIGRFDLDSK